MTEVLPLLVLLAATNPDVDTALCRHLEPVEKVRDLSIDDPQSTVRWVHEEEELWMCHGSDGCLWMPLLHGECQERREMQ